jgi:hypothetical protein
VIPTVGFISIPVEMSPHHAVLAFMTYTLLAELTLSIELCLRSTIIIIAAPAAGGNFVAAKYTKRISGVGNLVGSGYYKFAQ